MAEDCEQRREEPWGETLRGRHTGLFSLGSPEGIFIKGAKHSQGCLEKLRPAASRGRTAEAGVVLGPRDGGGPAAGAGTRGQQALMAELAVGASAVGGGGLCAARGGFSFETVSPFYFKSF